MELYIILHWNYIYSSYYILELYTVLYKTYWIYLFIFTLEFYLDLFCCFTDNLYIYLYDFYLTHLLDVLMDGIGYFTQDFIVG